MDLTKEERREIRKQQFIAAAKTIHANEKLDYSKVIYIDNRTPVTIIDHDLREDGTEYGEYKVTPSNHLKGQGHRDKRGLKISKSKRSDLDKVIKQIQNAHPDEIFDFSESVYINMHTKMKIIDRTLDIFGNEYGEYEIEPASFIKGVTSKEKLKKIIYNNFLLKSRAVHGDKYVYAYGEYVAHDVDMKMICPTHGAFWQTPAHHYNGCGCPACAHIISKAEKEISDYIKSLIGEDNVVDNIKAILPNNKELDIYVPSKKIAIEYNGLHWHSDYILNKKLSKEGNEFTDEEKRELAKELRNSLNDKTNQCKKLGIRLIHIFEDEYIEHKDIVLAKLKHIFGCDSELSTIGARKCKVMPIRKFKAEEFLNKYHIQGFSNATLYLGAFYKDKLVAVMTFLNEGNDKWNLLRFATDVSLKLPGIASKMFKYFKVSNDYTIIKSFLDRRWNTEGNTMYERLGFKVDKIEAPDYYYVKDKKRYHKFSFRKQKLLKTYGEKYCLNNSMTEAEMTAIIGFSRIYNCGLVRYVYVDTDN
jgi:hypothetical protein